MTKIVRMLLCLPYYIFMIFYCWGMAMYIGAGMFWDWATSEFNREDN